MTNRESSGPGGGIVVVVSPSETGREVLCDALEALGHTVFQASSSEQAHTILGHLEASPDLIIADKESARELRNDPRVLKMVVMSTDRPFTHAQLNDRISSAMGPGKT